MNLKVKIFIGFVMLGGLVFTGLMVAHDMGLIVLPFMPDIEVSDDEPEETDPVDLPTMTPTPIQDPTFTKPYPTLTPTPGDEFDVDPYFTEMTISSIGIMSSITIIVVLMYFINKNMKKSRDRMKYKYRRRW